MKLREILIITHSDNVSRSHLVSFKRANNFRRKYYFLRKFYVFFFYLIKSIINYFLIFLQDFDRYIDKLVLIHKSDLK